MSTAIRSCQQDLAQPRFPGRPEGWPRFALPNIRGALRAQWIRQPDPGALIQRWVVQVPGCAPPRRRRLTAG